MQTVSFETAIQLKNAGFSQPKKYQPGMVAYYELAGNDVLYALLTPAETMLTSDDVGEVIAYAPTATELLPNRWSLNRVGTVWACISPSGDIVFGNYDNPAEAAAKAWLFVNQK